MLLALAIGGVLAWLALSADKTSEPSKDEANVALSVTLEEVKPVAQEKPEAEEANTAAVEAPAVEAVEAPAPEIAEPEQAEPEQAEPEAAPAVNIALATPPAPTSGVIALALPDPALLQETSRGALPIIGPDGREPWRVYGAKVGPAGDWPRMAIIVSGLGLSDAATAGAIKLPRQVTLSFTPYGADLEAEVAAARAAGHEVLLDLPMEPISYPADDPGPHTLLTSLNPSDNIARLDWLLGRFQGYVGVINHMGSRFTASPEPLRPILRALKDRGLMFVDSRSTSKSVAAGLAGQMRLPRAINDRFLDHEPTRGAIDQSFAAAEGEARARGVAVVVARPFPVTLERMAAWLPMLESRGIEIVPVTALADKQVIR